jgi:hypothetical protein
VEALADARSSKSCRSPGSIEAIVSIFAAFFAYKIKNKVAAPCIHFAAFIGRRADVSDDKDRDRSKFLPASSDTSGRDPKHPGSRDGIDRLSFPPGEFVSMAMDVTVMDSAQWHRELVAYLEAHRAGLGESQMVRVSGASPADQTWLRCHELEVGFVAEPTHLADREYALVDLALNCVALNVCRGRREFVIGRLWDNRGRSR